MAIHALRDVLAKVSLQCVVLGDGDENLHEDLVALAAEFPDQMRIYRQYDEPLAHRIIAGSDVILTPSRIDPCGLTHLYALKYGSVPIMRRTGGLTDTVCDCTLQSLAAGRLSFAAPSMRYSPRDTAC